LNRLVRYISVFGHYYFQM